LCDKFKPKSEVPPFLSVTDIAGLVKGAAEGQGLGNAFLSHIRGVDAIFHMIRVFPDTEITHVEGELDPIRDLEIIHHELILKDIEVVETSIAKVARQARADKQAKIEHDMYVKFKEWLEAGHQIRCGKWNAAEVDLLNPLQLLTAKSAAYLINCSPDDYMKKKNKWLMKIKQWVDERTEEPIIPISADFESKIFDMPEDEKEKYLKENNASSCLDKVVLCGYKSLGLCHFFTAGTDEVKCWTVQKGTKAPQAAGRIHTDFEKGFICAEVMNFADLKELQTELAVKAAGKLKQQGKEYVVVDGDIIFFKFNAGAGLTAKAAVKK
jgi:obg-like ATPase 1